MEFEQNMTAKVSQLASSVHKFRNVSERFRGGFNNSSSLGDYLRQVPSRMLGPILRQAGWPKKDEFTCNY